MVGIKTSKRSISVFIGLIIFITMLSGCGMSQQQVQQGISTEDIGKQYSAEDLIYDLEYMFQTMEEVHPDLYDFTSREKVYDEIDNVKEKLNQPATRTDFYQKVAPIIAMLGDGHTRIFPPQKEWANYLEEGGKIFPLNLNIYKGRAFLKDRVSLQASKIEAGSELLSINGSPVEDIINNMVTYISGENNTFKEKILELHFFEQLLWLLYGFEDRFEVEILCLETEEIKTGVLEGKKQVEVQNQGTHQDNHHYSFHKLSDINAGVIDFRSFYDLDDFEIFLEDTFHKIKEKELSHLIIDIRENGGGNSQLGDALLEYLTDEPYRQFTNVEIKVSDHIKSRYGPGGFFLHLQAIKEGTIAREGKTIKTEGGKNRPKSDLPLRFDGEIYLLTSPFTYSSATSFASVIKHYDIGTVIGEETGGLLVTYGDVYSFKIPNTKLPIGVSHKRFVSPGGSIGKHKGVKPDYEVIQTSEDLADGQDTVMEFTKELIESETVE